MGGGCWHNPAQRRGDDGDRLRPSQRNAQVRCGWVALRPGLAHRDPAVTGLPGRGHLVIQSLSDRLRAIRAGGWRFDRVCDAQTHR